jgi:hypothetical protein
MRRIRASEFFSSRIDTRDASTLSDNYHTARATTLILIRPLVRRGLEDIRFPDHDMTSGARASGNRVTSYAMNDFEFSGASPILVAVKESRFASMNQLITA